MSEVKSNDLDTAIQFLRDGGTLYIPTYARVMILTKKTLNKFEAAGSYLLKEEGTGYRLKRGRSSIYLFAGQLKYKD